MSHTSGQTARTLWKPLYRCIQAGDCCVDHLENADIWSQIAAELELSAGSAGIFRITRSRAIHLLKRVKALLWIGAGSTTLRQTWLRNLQLYPDLAGFLRCTRVTGLNGSRTMCVLGRSLLYIWQ